MMIVGLFWLGIIAMSLWFIRGYLGQIVRLLERIADHSDGGREE